MIARGPPRHPPGTLAQLFFRTLERSQRADAYQVGRDGRYRSISHAAVRECVRHIALGLQELGFARGDRLAILSENRPEWAFTDWACLTLGIADIPICPTLPAEQIPHLQNDSGAAGVFVSKLQGLASFETPKRIALLEHDLSIERGKLTPTLTVKRRVMDRDYEAMIDY